MNMRKLLASGRWVKQVAVITYSADLPSIFLGCDYMVFLPSILLCNEKEGIRNWVFAYFYKHKFWVDLSEKISIGYLWVVGENGREMGYRCVISEYTFLNGFCSCHYVNIMQIWRIDKINENAWKILALGSYILICRRPPSCYRGVNCHRPWSEQVKIPCY